MNNLSSMEPLNLKQHSFTNMQGTSVTINNCLYEIGERLDAGPKTIVHKLINQRSGLCLHVAKFYPSAALAEEMINKEIAAKAIEHVPGNGGLVPNVMSVTAHEGVFLLQDYLGPYEERAIDAIRLMSEADERQKNGDHQGSLELYLQVLQLNPFHTAALNNIAYAYAKLGDPGEAYGLMARVMRIEGNHLAYQKSIVQYGAHAGHLRETLERFRIMKRLFPYESSCDGIAVYLYRMTGWPEEALVLQEKSTPKKDDDGLLKKDLQNEVKAKENCRATLTQARELICAGRSKEVPELLDKAYALYANDPVLWMNRAAAFQAQQDYQRAKDLWLAASRAVPFTFVKNCYFNAAFCDVRLSNAESATALLDATMLSLKLEYGEQVQTDLMNLPGVCQWIGNEGIMDEPFESAIMLIDTCVSTVQKATDSLKELAGFYRQAGNH
jgi:tetratricopeptide (TPR) repeat protein